MLEIIMALTYAAVLIFSIYHVVKSFRTSHHELREEIAELRKDISSRVIVTYKVIVGFIRSPILLIAFFMLPTCMTLSAVSTQYSLSVSSRDIGHTGIYAAYVKFKEPVSIGDLEQYLSEFRGRTYTYIRYVLDDKLVLTPNEEKLSIYALVGIPSTKSAHLFKDLSLNDHLLVLGSTKTYNKTVTLFSSEYLLMSLNPEIIENISIFYGIPLLPVEAYLGTKPITIPVDAVLISTTSTVSKLINSSKPVTTDLVIEFSKEELETINVTVFSEIMSKYDGIVMVLRDNILETSSSYGLPTTDSFISAIVSALISSIILSVTFISLQPKVRLIYSKLSIAGLQPWNLTAILTIFVGIILSVIGISSVAVINNVFGVYSAINSFTTFIISTTAVIVFINRKVFNVSVIEVVPTPVSTKFNLIVKGVDTCKALNVLSELLNNEEFFELKDIDMKCEPSGGFLHASCRFRGSWGVGVDLDLFAGNYGERDIELSFNIFVWSIEELSEKQLESVLRLFESKIVGGLRVWVMSQGAQ
ncbi:MAG: hypothetical protein QXZ10_02440 [Sulfolobales archaeon]